MPIELSERAGGKVLVIKLTGKLTTEDYARFLPEVDRLVEQHGKLRVLIQMHDFRGWSAGAGWEDFKFGLKHYRDIDRLAIVGDRTWEHALGRLWKPFTKATIRYFDSGQEDQSEAWARADLPPDRQETAPV